MTHSLTIEPLGATVEVGEGQTILDACLRAGIWLPHACGHGLCGTCKVDVTEGVVRHGTASPFALMDIERDEGKTLACTATLDSDTVIEADIDEEPDARLVPVRDFSGTVSRIEKATHDVKRVVIAVAGDGITFQAGQYINLHIPSVDVPRPFSIASPPRRREEIELHIRLVPGGVATAWLHEKLAEGDRVAFSGPYGRFFVRKSAPEPMLFLAGGTGVSSPRSMILDLLEVGRRETITLVHGVRTRADLYDDAMFTALAAQHDNFEYIPALSHEPAGSAWVGERGFVHEVAAHLYDGFFGGLRAYLCGPPPMVDACITTLMRGRLFETHIFTERFLTARDGVERRSPVFRRL